MANEILNVGLDNMVAQDEIVAIARPDSLPIKQLVTTSEQDNMLMT